MSDVVPELHGMDVFGGEGQVSEAMAAHMWSCWKYEILDDDAENILSDEASPGSKKSR